MLLLQHVVYELKTLNLIYKSTVLSGSYWSRWLGFSWSFELGKTRSRLRSFNRGMLRRGWFVRDYWLWVWSRTHILLRSTMLGGRSALALVLILLLDFECERTRFLLHYNILVESFVLHDILSKTNCKWAACWKLSDTFLFKTHYGKRMGSVNYIAKSQLTFIIVTPAPNDTFTV